ncbi:hypothetical protein [Serratia ficaria]|uniref:hypothetical protein n=1 Tax=Serratia ficaria TaxID=61651 RepID=UPI0021B7817A|nr:hypothetical protein [Serratia ficaria]
MKIITAGMVSLLFIGSAFAKSLPDESFMMEKLDESKLVSSNQWKSKVSPNGFDYKSASSDGNVFSMSKNFLNVAQVVDIKNSDTDNAVLKSQVTCLYIAVIARGGKNLSEKQIDVLASTIAAAGKSPGKKVSDKIDGFDFYSMISVVKDLPVVNCGMEPPTF